MTEKGAWKEPAKECDKPICLERTSKWVRSLLYLAVDTARKGDTIDLAFNKYFFGNSFLFKTYTKEILIAIEIDQINI